MNEANFNKAVELVLSMKGLRMRDLYEYPYNVHESAQILSQAEKIVEQIVELEKDTDGKLW